MRTFPERPFLCGQFTLPNAGLVIQDSGARSIHYLQLLIFAGAAVKLQKKVIHDQWFSPR